MWFLWSLITFVVILFSTSQLLAYIVCFLRYPELLVDLPAKNKRLIVGGMCLHAAINLTWIVLVCSIPAIRQHGLAIGITAAIGLVISLRGVWNDHAQMYANFCQLTDKELFKKQPSEQQAQRERDEPTLRAEKALLFPVLQGRSEHAEHPAEPLGEQDDPTTNSMPDRRAETDRTDSSDADATQDSVLSDTDPDRDDMLDDMDDEARSRALDDWILRELQRMEQDFRRRPTAPNANRMPCYPSDDGAKPYIALPRNKKKQDDQVLQLFRSYLCSEPRKIWEYNLDGTPCTLYAFSIFPIPMLTRFCHLAVAKCGKVKRYFATEMTGDGPIFLCEWVMENGKETVHRNYGMIAPSYLQLLQTEELSPDPAAPLVGLQYVLHRIADLTGQNPS